MSSVSRFMAVKKELPVKYTGVSGPWYEDLSAGQYQLYPFTVSKQGVLDLNINYDGFITWFNEGDEPENTGTSGYTTVQLFGGQQLISSLGPNFIQYIRNWLTANDPGTGNIDPGSPINIYIAPIMTKVQLANESAMNTDDYAYTASDTPPSGDNYVFGNEQDGFKTSWIFKTPLTFTYLSSGVIKYITMFSLLQTDYA